MAKKSEIIGEYIVTIDDNDSVSVSRIYKSTKKALSEIAEANELGRLLFSQFCNGEKEGTIGEYAIERESNDRINVIRTYSNTMEGLREVAKVIGYEEDDKENGWNTQDFGRHLIDYYHYSEDIRAELISKLDMSKWWDGTMDKYVERLWWLKDTYQKTLLTAFVVDEDDDLDINDLGEHCEPPIRSKYIDLSYCQRGDYKRMCTDLSQVQYDGLLIDNIDKIPNNEDRDYWKAFVRFALKREDEYPLPPSGDNINFSKMHIAVRCKKYPEYLMGKSLQCFIIEPNNRFHSLLDKDKEDSI